MSSPRSNVLYKFVFFLPTLIILQQTANNCIQAMLFPDILIQHINLQSAPFVPVSYETDIYNSSSVEFQPNFGILGAPFLFGVGNG